MRRGLLLLVVGSAGAGFPGEGGLVLGLDGDGHADVGEVFLQGNNVLVEQADAALTGAAGDGVFVVGAAVDADAAPTVGVQAQEPVAVGQDVAAAVLEVVFPGRGVLYHRNAEGSASGGFGRAHVAFPLFVALVLAHAAGELCHDDGVAGGIAVIHAQCLVALGYDNPGGAGGLGGHGRELQARLGGRSLGAGGGNGLGLPLVVGTGSSHDGNDQQGEDDKEFIEHNPTNRFQFTGDKGNRNLAFVQLKKKSIRRVYKDATDACVPIKTINLWL